VFFQGSEKEESAKQNRSVNGERSDKRVVWEKGKKGDRGKGPDRKKRVRGSSPKQDVEGKK